MTNAFMTGSRYYGTPKKKSDLDLVILVDDNPVPDTARTAKQRIAIAADIRILLGIKPGILGP